MPNETKIVAEIDGNTIEIDFKNNAIRVFNYPVGYNKSYYVPQNYGETLFSDTFYSFSYKVSAFTKTVKISTPNGKKEILTLKQVGKYVHE